MILAITSDIFLTARTQEGKCYVSANATVEMCIYALYRYYMKQAYVIIIIHAIEKLNEINEIFTDILKRTREND